MHLSGREDPSTLEHRVMFHDGADELVAALAPELASGLARGDRVLICLDESTGARLAAAVGDAGDVTVMPADVRYARPAGAMGALHDFVRGAADAGAPSAWAVGAIGFDGTANDQQWHRYEAAVNEVFTDLPLRAVCAYDTAALPQAAVAAARCTHPLVADTVGVHASPDFRTDPVHDTHAVAWFDDVLARAGAPRVDDDVRSPAFVRDRITALLGAELDPGRLAELHLAATELITNALRHGRPPARCTIWSEPEHVVVRVEDRGPGITDPYAELRPPRGQAGGWGLWLVGQLSERVLFERSAGRTVVTAALTR